MDKPKIDSKKIKALAEGFLQKIAPEARVEVLPIKDATVSIDAKVDDAQLFVGQGAETLLAIQHLLRVILRKAVKEQYYIDLDINGYKKKRREYLKELAMLTANEVSLSGKEKFLSPMAAYERRVVHMELSERFDIVTESFGRDPDRRIIIKPRPKK